MKKKKVKRQEIYIEYLLLLVDRIFNYIFFEGENSGVKRTMNTWIIHQVNIIYESDKILVEYALETDLAETWGNKVTIDEKIEHKTYMHTWKFVMKADFTFRKTGSKSHKWNRHFFWDPKRSSTALINLIAMKDINY